LCQDEDVAEDEIEEAEAREDAETPHPTDDECVAYDEIEEAEARDHAETPHPTDDEDDDAEAALQLEVVVLVRERLDDLEAQARRLVQEQNDLVSMMLPRIQQYRQDGFQAQPDVA